MDRINLNELKNSMNNTNISTATYSCELCMDSGWIDFVDDGGYDVTKKCICRVRKETEARLQRSGIGDGFKSRTFENFSLETPEHRKICELAWKYKNDESAVGILFCGRIGSGKTHLGVAILNEWLQKGKAVRFWNYADMIRDLSRNVQESRFDEIMHQLKTSKRLMIDDLFKANVRETHVNYVYEVVNYRYENKLKTIFTSEKTIGQLVEIDEGIGSRIAEMCRGYAIDMEKLSNYRMRGSK